jgi:MFS family permease
MLHAVMAGQTIMASLIGYQLSGSALNTLPMAIQMVSVMGSSVVATWAFTRFGRKKGFWLSCAIMFAGSLTFAAGVYTKDFVIYCLGAIPAGVGFGMSHHLRFAAAEVAAPEAKARAISLVMAGGVLSAIVGPEMVKQTHDLMDGFMFLATYLYLPALPIVAAFLLWLAELPPAPPKADRGEKVPFRDIITRPNFVTAVISSLVGYGTMNLLMASTPLEMLLCGFGVAASAEVIRAHSVAMYAPGFVTGRLIQRFGNHQIILAGATLTALAVALNLAFPSRFWTFFTALAILGVGWNFMFVGGTTMLTTAYAPAERVKVQATHDFIVFANVALTALTSGAIEAVWGYAALNLTVLPPVIIASAVVCWHWAVRRPKVAAA